MKRYLSALILLLSGYLSATTVTGTIQDTNGNRYSNGTVSAFNLITGASMTPSTTDANGAFSITLLPSTYAFTVCAKPVNIGPNGGTSVTQVCAQPPTPIVISGGSQDVSAQINAVAPILGPSVAALLGANNAFTGNNTHAGTEAFNGAVSLTNTLTGSGAAVIAGIFGGSPIMTGNWMIANFNKVISVDGTVYATSGVGIQAAITAQAAAGGGTVYIPAGTYTATANIIIPNNISLLCSQGWATQINFVDDHSSAMIGFKGGTSGFGQPGVSNVGIYECSFRATGVTGRTGVLGLASFFNSTNIYMVHNQIGAPLETNTQLASPATGAYFENVNNVTFNFNTVDGTQADGAHFVRGTTNGTVIGNKFKFTGDDSIALVSIVTDDGVNTYPPVSFFTVTGNTIEQNGGNTGGLSPNASGITCAGCTLSTFTSNTINSPAGPCINITAVIGNVNGNSTRYPFQDIAAENTCNNSGAIGTTNAALVMQFARASRMHHNTVSTHSSDCAFGGGVGKDNIWDDNWLSGCTGRAFNGIQASSTEARLIAELWTAFNDGTPARVGISNLTFHHNILSRPTLAAIEIDGEAALNQTGDIISENQIYNTPANQQGILAIRVDNSQFLKNNCTNINNNACTTLSTGTGDVVDGGIMATGTGASSSAVNFLSMNSSVVQNIYARNAGLGVFIDNGGANNCAKNNDLRGNTGGSILVQDTTSCDIMNQKVNFTGQRTQTLPDASGAYVLDTAAQTLTSKTLTSPVLNGSPLGSSGTIGIGYDSVTGTEQHNSNNQGASSFSGAWQCTNVTPVTVNTSTTADQNMMACTLPAGTLNRANRSLRISTAGIYSTPAASTSQMTAKVKLCTVSGCGSGTVLTLINIQSTALGTVQITNDNWGLSALSTVQTAGASSAHEAHGDFLIDLATLTTAADSEFGDTNTATIGTIDSSVQLFIQVTFAFSAASGSNIAVERQLLVETVN